MRSLPSRIWKLFSASTDRSGEEAASAWRRSAKTDGGPRVVRYGRGVRYSESLRSAGTSFVESANGVRCGRIAKKSRTGAPCPGSRARGKSRLYWSNRLGSLSSASPSSARYVSPAGDRSRRFTVSARSTDSRSISPPPTRYALRISNRNDGAAGRDVRHGEVVVLIEA